MAQPPSYNDVKMNGNEKMDMNQHDAQQQQPQTMYQNPIQQLPLKPHDDEQNPYQQQHQTIQPETKEQQTYQPQPQQPMHAVPMAQDPQKSSGEWSFGLFDCFSPGSLCCATYWCPCYVFGKTHARETTGESNPSGMNGMCAAFCCLMYFGVSPFIQCVQRTSHREKHGIRGDSFKDFLTACCCACCAIIQEEKESIVKINGINPKTNQPYNPPPGMTYP